MSPRSPPPVRPAPPSDTAHAALPADTAQAAPPSAPHKASTLPHVEAGPMQDTPACAQSAHPAVLTRGVCAGLPPEVLRAAIQQVQSQRPTAAIPMENPYCSCKLTRVRPAVRGRDGRRAQGAGGHPGVHASFVRRLRSSPLSALCSLPPFFSALCSPPPFFSALCSLLAASVLFRSLLAASVLLRAQISAHCLCSVRLCFSVLGSLF